MKHIWNSMIRKTDFSGRFFRCSDEFYAGRLEDELFWPAASKAGSPEISFKCNLSSSPPTSQSVLKYFSQRWITERLELQLRSWMWRNEIYIIIRHGSFLSQCFSLPNFDFLRIVGWGKHGLRVNFIIKFVENKVSVKSCWISFHSRATAVTWLELKLKQPIRDSTLHMINTGLAELKEKKETSKCWEKKKWVKEDAEEMGLKDRH